ncbi:hypothetical protein CRG98_048834, partial [Punica granatum]
EKGVALEGCPHWPLTQWVPAVVKRVCLAVERALALAACLARR